MANKLAQTDEGRKNKVAVSVKDLINKYHIWDARRISQLLPNEEFIDVTVTSPPYWNLKDYGVESQIGFGQEYDECLDDLEQVFRNIYAVTSKRGSLWVISDTIKRKGKIKLLPFDLAERLEQIGWILQDIIIWNKDRTLPWSHQGKLRNIFEYMTFYSKGRRFNYHLDRVREVSRLKEWWVRYPERYSPEGKAPARTWYIPIPRQGSWGNNWVRHFNPLPPELVERILLLTTDEGDIVLDPFCGSGAVLAQAHVMGRNYVGLDLSPSYKEMFEQRVLPAISALHEEGRERTREMRKQKKAFGNLIRSLRRTKYPKELMRLYVKEHGRVDLEAVLALQKSESGHLEVIFLFPGGCQAPSDFLPRVIELSKRPPLSKYGFRAVLTACSVDLVSQEWLRSRGLDLGEEIYLYAKGQTYAWIESMSVQAWLELVEGDELSESFRQQRYPTIVSDIGVRVDPKSPSLPIEEER